MAQPSPSARAQQQLGLPEGFKTWSPFPFDGMNTSSTALAIADKEWTWRENFIKLDDGYLRTAWDLGPAIYDAGAAGKLVYYAFYSIASTQYVALFLSDGSALQMNMATLATTEIGSAGAFYNAASGFLPCCRQWGTQYLLIGNRNTTNDYWIWDGALLYTAGSAAPNGVTMTSVGFNYSSTPTITVTGGSGSGLQLQPYVSNGGVVNVAILNPGEGYEIGDTVSLAFSGGGSDSAPVFKAYLSAGLVGSVIVSAGGSGYTSAPSVTFSGGGGAGAAGTVQVSGGAVVGVTIINPGSGYTSAPNVTFSGPGTGATGASQLAPAGVGGVTVVNGGSGFTSVPTLTFSGGGGSGAVGVAVLAPTSVAAINLTAGGSSYTSAPTVAFVGGGSGGSGAAATAVLSGDTVSQIIITNAGSGYTAPIQITLSGGGGSGAGGTVVYAPTSIASVTMSATGQFYTNAPSVSVSAGANNAAYATVALMPYGVSGSSIETYLSRVWICNPAVAPYATVPPGGQFQYSAAGSLVDFATSDGGGLSTNSDAFLQTRYVNVRQSAGYLYFFGDGSVSALNNVATGGNPTVTTYNYLNVDPQAGCDWRDVLQDFGRSTIFGNATGIFGLYGGAVTKISSKLDGLFQNMIFPPAAGAITPSSAVAFLFKRKHFLGLMTVLDPDLGIYRNVMLTWNEKDWCITSQSTSLTFIATQKVGSNYTAYGMDGRKLYPLFAAPSMSLTKRLDTKAYGTDKFFVAKNVLSQYLQASDMSSGVVGISGTLSAQLSGIGVQNEQFPSAPSGTYNSITIQPFAMTSPTPYFAVWGSGTGGMPCMSASFRLSTTSPDFILGNWVIGYNEITALG